MENRLRSPQGVRVRREGTNTQMTNGDGDDVSTLDEVMLMIMIKSLNLSLAFSHSLSQVGEEEPGRSPAVMWARRTGFGVWD